MAISDFDAMANILNNSTSQDFLETVHNIAAKKLFDYDREVFPKDACAITLSVFFQQSGLHIPDIFGALEMVNYLINMRNWSVIDLGQQQRGDVGTTCDKVERHGIDHVYTVINVIEPSLNYVLDNQNNLNIHKRPTLNPDPTKWPSPTTKFLRPPTN